MGRMTLRKRNSSEGMGAPGRSIQGMQSVHTLVTKETHIPDQDTSQPIWRPDPRSDVDFAAHLTRSDVDFAACLRLI